MKNTILPVALLFSPLMTQAQVIDTSNTPLWIDMMQDMEGNFFETQRAFELYWEGREQQRGDGWKVFKRWEWYWSQRINEDGSFPDPDATLEAYTDWRIAYNQGLSGPESETGDWVEIGPRPKPYNGTGQPNGNGRLNYVEFHPTDPMTLWAGSPSGGFWKTTNGGTSWTTTTDNLPTLGVSSILVDSSNTNIIYIGTGDRDGGDAPGLGVYKSTNGGQNFFASNSGMGNKTVGQLLMHPDDPDYLLAATSSGIYRSQNGGATWTLESGSDNFKDLKFKPGEPDVVYATETTTEANFWRSTDGGDTWTMITSGIPSASQRLSIGISADDPNVVYLLRSQSSAYGGLYRSNNSGLNFSTQSTSPNILSWSENPPTSGGGGQGWYDLAIAIDPTDADVVYVGGVNVFKSTNAGVTWDCVAHWVGSSTAASVHADHHWLEFSPVNNRLYDCNDGGLYYTSNGGLTWPEVSDSLGISQIYRIGVSTQTEALVINGYQDNGTAIWDNTFFRTERGGDGMECIIDPSTDNVIYATVYYGNIARSTNNGYSFGSFAAQNVNGITESGAWVTPYILHRNDPETMFIGYKNIWRTTDAYSSTPTFSAISSSLGGSNSSNMRTLRQSRTNSNRLYAVRSDNTFYRTDNAMAASPTWYDLTINLPGGWYIADIETSPNSGSRLWMIKGNTVYQSNNSGVSWFSINGNLPGIGKNCLVADSLSNGGLYIGTDAGVYYTDNSMSNWLPFDDGLPVSAEVTELEIYHEEGNWEGSRIRAATYGRGLWESDLYNPGNIPPLPFAQFSISGVTACSPGVITLLSNSAYGVDSLHWTVIPGGGHTFVNGTNANSNPAKLTFTQAGTYDIILYVENANGADSITVIDDFVANILEVELIVDDSTQVFCEGDTAIVRADPNLNSYTWYRNGVLFQVGSIDSLLVGNLIPGDQIKVVVTDNNDCTADDIITLDVMAKPESQLASSDANNTICEGDTVTFTNAGNAIMTHQFYASGNLVQDDTIDFWTTDSLNDGDSIYALITGITGCTGISNAIMMNVNPTPPTPEIVLLLDSLHCILPAEIYQWSFNNDLTETTVDMFAKQGDGIYELRIYLNGCWSAWSAPFIITGIASESTGDLIAYPNPASGSIFLEWQDRERLDQCRVSIIDMHGRKVFNLSGANWDEPARCTLDIGHLPAGVYHIVVGDGQQKIALPILVEKK